MKKLICISILLIICTAHAFGQILNQDADGESSIVWPGSTINLDISQELLKFNYINATNGRIGTIFGFDIQGKNSSGTASLFENGEFNPEARISVLYGRHKSKNISPKDFKIKLNDFQKIKDKITDSLYVYSDSLKNFLDPLLTNLEMNYKDKIDSTTVQNICSFKDRYFKITTRAIVSELANIFSEARADNKESTLDKDTKDALFNTLSIIGESSILAGYAKYKTESELIVERKNKFLNKYKISSVKTYAYIRGSLDIQEFKLDNGPGNRSIDERFQEEEFSGLSAEVGVSQRRGDIYWGINLGIERTNTFAALTKQTFNFTEIDTSITPGSLSSSRSIEAFSGDYETLNRFRIHSDILFTQPIGEKNQYVAYGPYVRANFNSNKDALQDNTVFGVGAYFIDGKKGAFLGGIYIQSNDINDIFGQKRDSPFTNTISFGLTTKFSFSSILSN